MKKVSYLPMLAFLAILGACNNKKNAGESSESFSTANPFYKASELAFQAPAFDKIKNGDFKPALEEGMKQQMDEIQKIADQTDAPGFENTILAIEKSGQLLSRTYMVFNLLTGANTNPELQKVKEEEAPKLTANTDAIY
ncbi:hypothetical protein ACUN24_19835 [Pedobacter sp. WC2501]|uniref:hypothetical protein n=1 Tax=Pedobacter sp. WC2501 TaxID=3461400 RepID=UPI004045E4E0